MQRYEKPNIIVSLGKAEGIIPWREQVPGETYNPGESIKCLVLDVRKVGQRVRIVLTRAHPDLLRHLFALEVPEIAERIIDIKELARDPGHRTKVAVQSIDHKVDCVGACVGIRGSRIKNIMFWVPQSAHLGLGISIFSYAGEVRLGVAVDAGLAPDPDTIVQHFQGEVEVLLEAARTTA